MLATHYVAHSFFLAQACSEDIKSILAFPQSFRPHTGSSIQQLYATIKKTFPNYGSISPLGACCKRQRVKTYQLSNCTSFTMQAFVRATTKSLKNVGHSSCTRNSNHLDLLIKTDGIEKERMMLQTIIRTF